MKGGGSIQIALLKRYSELKNFNGNIVLIAVPDEENLSAGMRSAVRLLSELQDKYNLKYKLTVSYTHLLRLIKSVFIALPFPYIRFL